MDAETRFQRLMEKHLKFRDRMEGKVRKPPKTPEELAERLKRRKLARKEKERKNPYAFLKGLPLIPNSEFENYLAYCKSKYFKRLKAEILKRADYKCKVCNGKANTAHHKKYRNKWTETKLKDCISICNPCHAKIHKDKIAGI